MERDTVPFTVYNKPSLLDDPAYRIGWRRALDRALEVISTCPALDENGYICEKSKVMKAVLDLARAQEQGTS